MSLTNRFYRKTLAELLIFFAITGSASAISEADEPASDGSVVVVFGSPQFWGQIAAIVALVVCSGIVAGLTLGLMSLDVTNLSILTVAGTPKQQKHAAKIMPIRKNGHLVLTALLLTNTVLNETLPVLCDGLFGKGYIAIILSTGLIVLFSEIIPQAVCSRNGLAIGAFFALPVKGLIGFWYILAWPIAKILDLLLGKHHGIMYNVPELVELIGLHNTEPGTGGPLERQTVHLLRNTLLLSQKSAGDLFTYTSNNSIATPQFMLHADTCLDMPLVEQILRSGCTAVPVYEEEMGTLTTSSNDEKKRALSSSITLVGILRTTTLAHALVEENKMPVRKLELDPILRVPSTISAMALLHILQDEPSHLVQVVHSGTHQHQQEEALCSEDGAGSSILESEPTTSTLILPTTVIGLVSLKDMMSYLFRGGDGDSAPGYETRVSIDNGDWNQGSRINRSTTSYSNISSATVISK